MTTSYDPAGALPVGTVVLEASAGTGKTHAIAAMATRFLAEGAVDADRLAVISFTRMASGELRSRVRERLHDTERLLLDAAGGAAVHDVDPTDALLTRGTRAELETRIGRLRRAVRQLDNASIMTIHQFCQELLDELGVLACVDLDATLVDDLALLLNQVAEDTYLRRYSHGGVPFDLATARSLATEAVLRSETPLWREGLTGVALERLAFADEVRDVFADRKRRLGVFSFDDQLLRLWKALSTAGGTAAVDRLRARFDVVLVDEFQDTDPVQWDILRSVFHSHARLVLIGDPKQAIYAFRGADIATYTDAVEFAGSTLSLDRNYRSDAAVVSPVNALFAGVSLGSGVEVPPVEATHAERRLVGAGAPPGMRLRCHFPDEPASAAAAREVVDADLVGEVVRLLTGGLLVVKDGVEVPLAEEDIAVLVSSNKRGSQLARCLTDAGVAVAFSGADSVFATTAARAWLALLRALEDPRRQTTRAAMLTDFLGGSMADLAADTEEKVSQWGAMLQNWARVLARSGVAALFAAVQTEGGMVERLLGSKLGERDLTDYRHLAELLHAQHSAGVRGQALVAWLSEAIQSSDGSSDRTRRLETDRHAVQILTVHKAKGLQFPVVLLPQAADLWIGDDEGGPLVFHADGTRMLDLGGASAAGRQQRWERAEAEAAEDRLRALYVAVTRAQSHVTLWWARTKATTDASPLHRLLFRDLTTPGVPAPGYPVDRHPRELDWLAAAGILVEDCAPLGDHRLRSREGQVPALVLRPWTRTIDGLWTRTSYSGLTAAVHARPVVLAAESVVEDEPSDEAVAAAEVGGPQSPMAALPGGTGFGSLVHEVLEHLDWHASDEAELRARLAVAVGDALDRYPVTGVEPSALVEGILPSLLTPLGPLTDGKSLSEIPIRDRLSELDFEFPLGGPGTTTTLSEVGRLLRRWIPADHPLAGYPAELAQPALSGEALRGFLTGSIDSVLRLHGRQGPRFVVIDYKTNRLSPTDDLRLAHFGTPAMAAEMIRSHYPLQAILYCVALHRFLAGRLPGYEPSVHLGGVGYLFVRGMAGRDAHALSDPLTGVFTWFPPAGLVVQLSDLLTDRRAS